MNEKTPGKDRMAALLLGALGVVYGDIGTSPLYALKECFAPGHGLVPTPDNVFGILSLIFWSLLVIVTIKYIGFVMRANNHGEGGILALLAMAFPDRKSGGRGKTIMIALGLFGAALLYGDGIITPAISVLSAVEGLNVATPALEKFILPITIVIIIGLFAVQRAGTAKMGKIFGPIMVIWFIVIALLGVRGIMLAPEVVSSVNPLLGLDFLWRHGALGFAVMGSVFLVVTGGEALYADMGHFGASPIRWAWFLIVLPALFLNYLGQGALLLHSYQDAGADFATKIAANPFYNLAPKWAMYPLVGLATAATVIASQALISGAFSLTMQAIQLGFLPRVEITHTSSHEKGQIYIGQINWLMMFACIGLVLGFRSSSNLAAAYGIAVTMTMLITSFLFYIAARRLWNWNPIKLGVLCGIFIIVEALFFGANALKIAHGGWFPLVVGLIVFTLMTTWNTGRQILRQRLQKSSLPLDLFIRSLAENESLQRVKGTAVFMAGNPNGTPLALLHNLKHNKVLHERVIMLTILTDDVPHVEREDRVQIEDLGDGFYRIVGHFGFMEEPSVPKLLRKCVEKGLKVKTEECTFFLSRENIVPVRGPGMATWREHLFAIMSRNAGRATSFFHIPTNRVIELGMQVEI